MKSMALYVFIIYISIYNKVYCVRFMEASLPISCKDNSNKPVDWWFIYKPPIGVAPSFEDGSRFVFITSRKPGKWTFTHIPITWNSMLQYTIIPMYEEDYLNHTGAIVYGTRNYSTLENITVGSGVVMTDRKGGFWLSHNIPGYPETYKHTASFPIKQLPNGHTIMCLSLDVTQLQEVVDSLTLARAELKYRRVSYPLKDLLHGWELVGQIKIRSDKIKETMIKTRKQGIKSLILSRSPGNKQCLYRTFAKEFGVVLDVYEQSDSEYLTTICSQKYSIRNIENISLKSEDEIIYIGNSIDKSRWAVSTAAEWQRRGASKPNYWTCLSSLDKQDDIGKGGIMVCIENYDIWWSFDNLKVAEPKCF